ncbi:MULTISPECIES: response regulator [Pseudanabaena]|uniref:histidine kinase n=2 Tax=Pseudanabaena TaxID=1152 RepID=L8MZ88_9CYAN|nr:MULTISPECIES: response regulator [Pseudanabaena]ELS31298.1 CheA signal transduction histidine kinase [Pseudanabaena biceps PCC 7429]MDG3496443.1 response regulator [Pseudanabaena catenata USMAC16]
MPNPEFDDLQLQEELRTLFELDTQKYLQLYVQTVRQLSATNWCEDIQQLYRCVHTIKGGSVTVGFQSVLEVSTILEDLLSDLRYLDVAPPLADGELSKSLIEAGELLIGSVQMGELSDTDAAVKYIQTLRDRIQSEYLPEWNEMRQVQQEFADQGFDLVILELEMAIEELPSKGIVPAEASETAKQTMNQLKEIGAEINLATSWHDFLQKGIEICDRLDCELWHREWMPFLQKLKESARQGGIFLDDQIVEKASPNPESLPSTTAEIPSIANIPVAPAADIQIPVPLDRLERSSQYLVETLMATRATQGFYQSVYSNLLPLVSLAQNSVQYITQLREVQDDYALLDASGEQDGLKVERYRQGYTAINRLLEISLRLIELGSETGESARRTADSIQTLDRSLRNLQQTIEESRLVPFATLAFRTRGILRDLIARVGKSVQLTIIGEQLELDAGTLRSLEPVLLHLLRNSYDHGIENAEEREKSGKPIQGKIELSLKRRGSIFDLMIRDDGRGIDPDRISQIAKSKGLPLTDTSTADRLLSVLCQSGFTSTKVVSDISGRGVGMDVVASQVALMNGKLSLISQVGKGTAFTIQIPVPHLFVRCMLLQAGDRTFAVPTSEIHTTMLVEGLLWQKTERSDYTIEVQEANTKVPAIDLYQYWQGQVETRSILPSAIAVRTKQTDEAHGIWLIADTLIGQSDLLVNPIPAPLVAPIGLIGMSLMPDGKLIPVIDSISFVEALFSSGTDKLTISSSPSNASFLDLSGDRQILVVDDAALMRRRIESSLSPQGYEITTCDDGMEAWEWLQRHNQPALLITDIEMPRMDGFTLIDRCRQAGWHMPILVISSRLAEEWSRETSRLGATDYLTKGFSTLELVNKVSSLLELKSPA